ncbi:ankyrin repeat-containing domain protein [Chlamydoabsidia padenii]|nr:ankyrin repeat-containing domain protein [Chlamydoabsidia padenii]
MTNHTIPSPPSSPVHEKPTYLKRKQMSITLPPIQDVYNKRLKSSFTILPQQRPQQLDIRLLKDFLQQGGSITCEKQGRCLLCCACQCQSMEALRLVVSNGLSCQHLCQDNVSALHTAASVGFTEALSFLLYHQQHTDKTPININAVTRQDNHTPLYRAVQANQLDTVSYLLSQGARLDIPDGIGRFPLHIAIMNRHLGCVSLLLDYQHLSKNNPSHTNITDKSKAPISPHLSFDHQSAIEDAVMAGYTPILDRLLQKSTITKEQQSDLLDLAVHWNRVECLERLISYGYDINHAKDKYTDTSSLLYKAVQQRKMDMVRVLCRAGAISCRNGRNPSLVYAANHGFLEMVPFLMTPCTSNDCIQQAVNLAAPLNIRQQLLATIIHSLKSSSNTTPLTPISPS